MTQQTTIGILMYPGAQLSAVYGLMDLFSTANRISMERSTQSMEPLVLSSWQRDSESIAIRKLDPSHDQEASDEFEPLAVVIIPPNLKSP